MVARSPDKRDTAADETLHKLCDDCLWLLVLQTNETRCPFGPRSDLRAVYGCSFSRQTRLSNGPVRIPDPGRLFMVARSPDKRDSKSIAFRPSSDTVYGCSFSRQTRLDYAAAVVMFLDVCLWLLVLQTNEYCLLFMVARSPDKRDLSTDKDITQVSPTTAITLILYPPLFMVARSPDKRDAYPGRTRA